MTAIPSPTRHDWLWQVIETSSGTLRTIGGKEQYIPETCPNGCQNRKNRMKFSILVHRNPGGEIYYLHGVCFACGNDWNPDQLSNFYGVTDGEVVAKPHSRQAPHIEPKADPLWMRHSAQILSRYLEHPNREALWSDYKNAHYRLGHLFDFHQLGVGTLPASRCHRPRLVVPFVVADEIVGFRGRQMHGRRCACEEDRPCEKWVQSAMREGQGRTLWNGEALLHRSDLGLARDFRLARAYSQDGPAGRTALLIENQIDAAFMEAEEPSLIPLAPMSGVSCWDERWSELIADSDLAHIVVMYDYDHAGNAPCEVRYSWTFCPAANNMALFPYLVPVEEEVERIVLKWLMEKPGRTREMVPPIYANPLMSNGAKRFQSLVNAYWLRGKLTENLTPPVTYHQWPIGTVIGTDVGSVAVQ